MWKRITYDCGYRDQAGPALSPSVDLSHAHAAKTALTKSAATFREGTTPITRAAFMFELIQKATDAGWFVTAELGAGAGQLKRA